MTRARKTARWLQAHRSDEFVKRAAREGFRSRAAYKLAEIDARDRIFAPGQVVVDLGAAPGGWSQLAVARTAPWGRVIAMDILDMDALAGVEFIRGDFRENDALERLEALLQGRPVDLVLSDMAPNMSGMSAVDQPRAMYLAELAMDLADKVLAKGGSVYLKLFQGEGIDEYVRHARERFASVRVRKPSASRPRSREVYLLARNYGMV